MDGAWVGGGAIEGAGLWLDEAWVGGGAIVGCVWGRGYGVRGGAMAWGRVLIGWGRGWGRAYRWGGGIDGVGVRLGRAWGRGYGLGAGLGVR